VCLARSLPHFPLPFRRSLLADLLFLRAGAMDHHFCPARVEATASQPRSRLQKAVLTTAIYQKLPNIIRTARFNFYSALRRHALRRDGGAGVVRTVHARGCSRCASHHLSCRGGPLVALIPLRRVRYRILLSLPQMSPRAHRHHPLHRRRTVRSDGLNSRAVSEPSLPCADEPTSTSSSSSSSSAHGAI
jgi:hypothetical protein